MAVCTATDVTNFTDISTGASAISTLGLIPIVQDRIASITRNHFISDIWVSGEMTFATSSNSITSGSLDFSAYGFVDGDEVFIDNSYRNNGYRNILDVSTYSIILVTTESVLAEPTSLSQRIIYIGVTDWPSELAYIAAQMVKYDYDDRPKKALGVTSRSLGPFSESFGSINTPYGYPQDIIDSLTAYTYVGMK